MPSSPTAAAAQRPRWTQLTGSCRRSWPYSTSGGGSRSSCSCRHCSRTFSSTCRRSRRGLCSSSTCSSISTRELSNAPINVGIRGGSGESGARERDIHVACTHWPCAHTCPACCMHESPCMRRPVLEHKGQIRPFSAFFGQIRAADLDRVLPRIKITINPRTSAVGVTWCKSIEAIEATRLPTIKPRDPALGRPRVGARSIAVVRLNSVRNARICGPGSSEASQRITYFKRR